MKDFTYSGTHGEEYIVSGWIPFSQNQLAYVYTIVDTESEAKEERDRMSNMSFDGPFACAPEFYVLDKVIEQAV